MKRRDFVKTVALSGMAVAASDLVGDLIAQSTAGQAARVAVQGPGRHRAGRGEAQRLQLRRHPLHAPDQLQRQRQRRQQRLRGLRRLRRRWRPRADAAADGADGGGGGGFGGADETAGRGAAGFGVRVIHSGVWGFASSPIVTEEEIRRIARMATEVAKASAIAKQRDVVLAPVRAYTEYWSTPVQKNPDTLSREDKQALVQRVVDTVVKNKEVVSVNASVGDRARVEVLRQLRGLVHRAGRLVGRSVVHRHRAQEQRDAVAHLHRRDDDRRLGDRRTRTDAGERRAHRRRGRRVLHRQAGRNGRQGRGDDALARDAHDPRDRRPRHRARSHPRLRSQLRRHELHQDLGPQQAEIRLEAVQRHRGSQPCPAASARWASTTTG